ncbi:MAG: hypothetical protein Q7S68_05415 [Deltaproteobacteria bacterium]|nr:hypothetical protein [Deltaproteobacteria bacterium]
MRRLFPLLSAFLLITLIGCSGKIEGTVFLDSNGDQVPDPQERSLTRLSLKISQDDVVIGKTNTNLQGKYIWPFTDSGYYCVEVDEPALQQNLMEAMSLGTPATGSSLLKPAFSLGGTLGSTAKGMTTAKAATTSTTPSTTTGTAGTTTTTTSESKDGPVSTPPKPAISDFGKICDNISGLKATFHIPVMIDYSKEVSRIPPPLKEVRRTGEKFSIDIIYPIGCVLEPLYVPDGLIPYYPVGDAFDPHVLIEPKQRRRIDFKPDVTSTGTSLYFQVEEEIPLGTHSVQIEPSVLCSGRDTHTLHPILIDLKAEPLITVKQNLNKSRGSSADSPVEWEIILKNSGSKKYDIDLVGAYDPVLSVAFDSGGLGCTSPGHKIECSISLNGEESKTVKMNVTLPSAAGERILNFDASVKVDLYEEEIEAEGAEFTLIPIPSS